MTLKDLLLLTYWKLLLDWYDIRYVIARRVLSLQLRVLRSISSILTRMIDA